MPGLRRAAGPQRAGADGRVGVAVDGTAESDAALALTARLVGEDGGADELAGVEVVFVSGTCCTAASPAITTAHAACPVVIAPPAGAGEDPRPEP